LLARQATIAPQALSPSFGPRRLLDIATRPAARDQGDALEQTNSSRWHGQSSVYLYIHQMVDVTPCDILELFEELRRQATACANLPEGAVSTSALREFLQALESARQAALRGSLKEIERAFREALRVTNALLDKGSAGH
jgi:hypothetical protein